MDSIKSLFAESLFTGFIDKEILSDVSYQPELLINQKTPPKKILSTILKELSVCNEFYISVAFVTTSGIATIINQLKELEDRSIKGYILVSQYLNFTQPEALKRLLKFSNIELRILTSGNAHAKGFIFKNSTHYNLIVGSSNLTASALATNKEWNIKVSALDNSGLVETVLKEFNADFANATVVTDHYVDLYNKLYLEQFVLSKLIKEKSDESFEVVTPNVMQEEALLNLSNLRKQGKKKAIIISATGTGKTFLSAFDAKKNNPNKLLFVVHRLTVAKDAMKTFKKVFGSSRTMGLYSGSTKDFDCDFIFSTVQTISQRHHFAQFNHDYFDYIIVDETHRSAADSYTRLLDYFTPQFLLGMTATPERTDGNNIFEQFDHNIAYEIRLNRAMEEEMLISFHYYGVSDLIVDDKVIDNKSDFNLLVSDERINRIIEQSKFYGTDNGILRGLIFCSRKEEANELSSLLNLKGLNTQALTGDNTEEQRAKAIRCLESDNLAEKLDYIITVDIFNEGIDIPKINQIIMLRPTMSAIIFIQQLGRGLRKTEGKGYLTVIDFIGNYDNNYLIPIALYGDTSYNKDTIRKLITEGSRMIPGASTINFDQITKERIFQSIDSANMQLLADLKKDYNLLKYRLGRIPMMIDFLENDSRDPFLFVEYAKSYYNFVKKIDKNSIENLNQIEVKLLELFAKDINNSKRVEESLILKFLIEKGSLSMADFKTLIKDKYGYVVSDETIESCVLNLNFEFIRENKNIVRIQNDYFRLRNDFKNILQNSLFKKFLMDSTKWSIELFNRRYIKGNYKGGLVLYNKYSRKDVCRLLNWGKDISSTVYGYRTNFGVTPCFVTYKKSSDVENSINYNDHFINPSLFAWESRSRRTLESEEIKQVINSGRVLLFVKKDDPEGKDFYFLGDVLIDKNAIKQDHMPGSKLPVVHFKFHLQIPVDENIYNYLTGPNLDKNISKIILPQKVNYKNLNLQNQLPLNFDYKIEGIAIPLYNFYAAAGSFSELQSDDDFTLIQAPSFVKDSNDYFACKIVGESMNRVIPNGSIALFKHYSGGSRNGKIVLIENLDIQDQDFNSAFTVKTYSSEKIVTEEGWSHSAIKLLPNSYDDSYFELIIDEHNGSSMRIIGEFIAVL